MLLVQIIEQHNARNEKEGIDTEQLSTDIAQKKRKKFQKEHEDPDIQAELDKGNTVNILYDPAK